MSKYKPMPVLSVEDIKRFESKLQREGDCLIWTAATNGRGYGVFRLDGQNYLAHRIAYYLYYGEDPDDLLVCHRCDNPSCCEASHLWLGDQQDNMVDMSSKGRSNPIPMPGSKNPSAKLTESDVRFIKESDLTQRKLASLFSVSHTLIGSIKRGQSWKHVD